MKPEVNAAIDNATLALCEKQEADGSWIGEVDLNPGPSAQLIMLFTKIKREIPKPLAKKCLNYILRTQNTDGGWSPYYGAPSEVSVTCECYVAMRLLGLAAHHEACTRAAKKIAELGGVGKANPWTHLYMSVLGIIPWDDIYKTPIESLLIPKNWPIHVRYFSYWVKVITVPMSLLGHLGPGEPIELSQAISHELNCGKGQFHAAIDGMLLNLFYPFIKKALKYTGAYKKRAEKLAWEWIDTFTEKNGDFGGNSCTAINVILCLYLSKKSDDPRFEAGIQALLSYAIEDKDEWRLQTCQSHIWDTGFALISLPKIDPANIDQNTRLKACLDRGVDWLRTRQILDVYGEWSHNVQAKPGGWCFGNRHEHYPVTDCTATSLLSIAKHAPTFKSDENILRGVKWLLAMQHESGGWSAYEKYRGSAWANRLFTFKDIPDALSDVPKADVSGKVVEALAEWRDSNSDTISANLKHNRKALNDWQNTIKAINNSLLKAREFLLSARESNQLWRGNYGINYIYGTSFASKALRAIDKKPSADWAPAIREFFLAKQNEDGGWGENEESYKNMALAGIGPSSPVQTAWALLGLAAAIDEKHDSEALTSIRKGAQFLMNTQLDNGTWDEKLYLGTVFPGMVYFRYTYYPLYFPLMALEHSRKLL